MIELVGKIVEIATGETTYAGKLVEVNETEAHLESELGWVVVPIERIASIKEKEEE